jgi:cobalt-zinc-cadmium resistance protein CzcA
MLEQTIERVLKSRLTIFLMVAAVALYGYFSFQDVPIDSFPDVSPPLVQVFTSSPGLSPVDVETQISYPIEISMYGLPKLDRVQSTSIFGLSRVNVYFEEGTDIYFARRLVNERLSQARNEIPEGLGNPQLGPITTGLGTVMMYQVKNKEGADNSLMERRTAQDWIVKPQLRTVPGVTGVLSLGGDVRQFQVNVDMNTLLARDLTLKDLEQALNTNNRNVGASFLERGGEEYLVRGYGWINQHEQGIEDIRNIVVANQNGTPVYVKDLAEIQFGSEIKRGTLIKDQEESVGGFVLKLIGTNTQDLLVQVDQKVDAINSALPDGMVMETFYSQGELVDKAVSTVTNALYIGAILVLVILYFFMGDIRSTLIIISTVPLAFLIAFIGMNLMGISANLMSLGGLAISIGMIGDSATVIVENTYRLLEERKSGNVSLVRIVGEAAREVIRPVVFATSIIIIVFLPLFSLEGVEGKMFKPLAYTITFALAGAIFLALTYIPIISSYILPEKGMDKEPWLVRKVKGVSRPLIEKSTKYPKMVFGAALVLFAASVAVFPFLGTEFQPTLREGTFAVRSVLPPGANLPTTTEYTKRMQESMQTYPEVEGVYSRVGRAEVGGDPEPVNVIFNVVDLKPLDEWDEGRDYEELQTAMAEKLNEDLPGVSSNFSQPIQLRTDELLSGVRAQVVASLYGDNLDTLAAKAQEIAGIAEGVEGAVDVRAQQQGGKPQILIRPDREQLARLGISIDRFLSTVETGIGGSTAGQVFEGIRRFDIFLRLQEDQRSRINQIRELPIRTTDGALIPLSEIADIEVFTGPKQISRNKASRRTYVQLNVRGRDMGGVVNELRQKVEEQVDLPAGYFTEYGGQFENQQRAMSRLMIVVPITLGLIFFMLFSTFGSWRYAVLIFLNIPFATIGGIFALWISGLYLSVPAAVGFIAIFGIAVLNGLVLVSYINQLREEGMAMDKSVVQASLLRLRPVLMTALTTGLGLLPLLLANDIGSNVQRPLAAVVVGGLFTSTLLTLVVLPTIYKWFAEPVTHAEL